MLQPAVPSPRRAVRVLRLTRPVALLIGSGYAVNRLGAVEHLGINPLW
jgi:hypothetical protein